MKASDLAEVARQAPEKRLELIELMMDAADEDGTVDYDRLNGDDPAISRAADEAREYSSRVQTMLRDVKWTTDHRF